MKTLIVCTNRYTNPAPVMPLGACLAGEAAERAGALVSILDLMFERRPLRALQSRLDLFKPDAVGLAVRNIDNNDIKDPLLLCGELPLFVDAIRKRTDAPIVLGGSAVGVMPEALLRHSGASWAVVGDGEIIFPDLLSTLARGGPVEAVPGVGWIEDGKLAMGPRPVSNSLDSCVVPDFSRWLDVRSYKSHMATVPIQTKRGCPYRCVYCTYQAIEGRGYRLSSAESVVDGVKRLACQGFREIELVDNVFNSPLEHAMAISEGLARAQPEARLQSLELNPLFIDDALMTAMKQAGFSGVGVTVESASDHVLSRLRKGFCADDIYRAADVIRRCDLPCLWILLFGCPGETESTVRETLNFVSRALKPQDVAFFNIGIRIYPGTEMEQIARDEGLLTIPPEEMLAPVFYCSPTIDRQWLEDELQAFKSSHLNCLDATSLGLPFLPSIHRLGRFLRLTPPLWKHTRPIRKALRLFRPDL